MINQLVRTKFESNLTAFIVFLALHASACAVLITINYDSWARPGVFPTGVALWLLLFCLLAAGLSLLRYNREKNSRLYAQLPVTSLQIRIAYWSHASVYLCISSLVLLSVIFYAGSTSVTDSLLFMLVYFFHAGVVLAVLSIITSNNLRLVPEEVRKRTIVYFLLATLITFLFLFAMVSIVAGYIHLNEEGVASWSSLTMILALLGAGLVALDVHLFRKKDNYLH